MTTTEERITALEAGTEHLATKADLAEIKADLHALETRLVKWMVGMMFGGMVTAAAIASAVATFLG